MRSNTWLWILAIAMLGALAWGLEQVAFTPLQTGEVYPPFSSLRADPMGAKALYESLAALPGIQVDRLYKQRQKLNSPRDAMFVLGVDPASWSRVDHKTLDEYGKLVHDGGRLVIAFLPVRGPGAPRESHKETPAVVLLWHIELMYRTSDGDDSSGGIPHKTALYFNTHSFDPEATYATVKSHWADWRPLATDALDQKAEEVEKTFGKGTIVLVADTYPLSNQGLREARDSGLIARIAGSANRITFDENHFGVSETGSVTQLMRRYRLQGAVAILIVAAALFLWRSVSSLLPPRSGALASSQGAIAGRDSLEGLSALLHRGVPEKQLLDVCFAEWSKSTSRGAHGSPGAREQSDPRAPRAAAIEDEIARQGARAPVDAYRTACRILTEKR